MPNNEDLAFFNALSCKGAPAHNGCTHATKSSGRFAPYLDPSAMGGRIEIITTTRFQRPCLDILQFALRLRF
jgi:hypothetical protein